MNIQELDLNEKCKSFIIKIEQDLDREIKIIYKDLGEHKHGYVKCENGEQIIVLNEGLSINEDVLIHEAYHIRLQIDGMPKIAYSSSAKYKPQFDKEYFSWFNTRFWDKITHHYFFQKMKDQLDIDPFSRTKQLVEDIISDGKFNDEDPSEIALISYIFQTWIETGDESYLEKMLKLIKKKYNSVGIEEGEYIIKILKDNPLVDFNACIKVYEEIFNFLHKKQNLKISIPKEFFYDKNCNEHIAFSIVDYAS